MDSEDADAAIRYARQQMSDKPADMLDDDRLREELTTLDAALDFEKATQDSEIVDRQSALKDALESRRGE